MGAEAMLSRGGGKASMRFMNTIAIDTITGFLAKSCCGCVATATTLPESKFVPDILPSTPLRVDSGGGGAGARLTCLIDGAERAPLFLDSWKIGGDGARRTFASSCPDLPGGSGDCTLAVGWF